MKPYTVYFEIYGKKMKTTVHAKSEAEAVSRVREKLVIHKVKSEDDGAVDYLMNMFGMK